MSDSEIADSGENLKEEAPEEVSDQPPAYKSAEADEGLDDDAVAEISNADKYPGITENMEANSDPNASANETCSYAVLQEEPQSWSLDPPDSAEVKKSQGRRISQTEMDSSLEVHVTGYTISPSKECEKQACNKESLISTGQSRKLEEKPMEVDDYLDIYQRSFDGPEKPIRPNDQFQWPTGGTMLVTTYKEDYPPRAVTRREPPIRHMPSISLSTQNVRSCSSYRRDFIPLPLERTEPCRPKNSYIPPTGAMETNTSYQLDFSPHVAQDSESLRPNQSFLQPSEPMEQFISHTIDYPPRNYIPKENQHSPTCQPTPLANVSAGTSSYRERLAKPDLVPFHSWRAGYIYSPAEQTTESKTVYQTTFRPISCVPNESFAPKPEYQTPKEPISDITSYRVDFQAPPLVQSMSFRPRMAYRRLEDEISSLTTYNTDYAPLVGDRVQPFIPKQQIHVPEGRYTNVSSYTLDFPNKIGLKTDKFTPKINLIPSTDPFLGESMYRTHFPGHDPVAVQSFKPVRSFSPPAVRMDNRTTYRLSYLPILHRKDQGTRVNQIPPLIKTSLPKPMQQTKVNQVCLNQTMPMTGFVVSKPTHSSFVSHTDSSDPTNYYTRKYSTRIPRFSLVKPPAGYPVKEMNYSSGYDILSFTIDDATSKAPYHDLINRTKMSLGSYNSFNDISNNNHFSLLKYKTDGWNGGDIIWDKSQSAYSNGIRNRFVSEKMDSFTSSLPAVPTKSSAIAVKKVMKVLNSEPTVGLPRILSQ
ncbi:hypothetical protein FBUS_04005 [Fasciolopsis buskii]|uniref:Uncharacterized protein n=1 Tax=Fasciolopsis buskii TaxID=27845 RepID=A0A8E0RXH3_9TREM|nr:hypothetical protein FBUS_04005 [Fasciolopsis buski]